MADKLGNHIMKTNILILSAIIPGILVLTSCQELPKEAIDKASAAVENAKTSGAEMYDAENYQLLEDSLKNAMTSVDAESGKFFKDYQNAIKNLEGVSSFATTVTTNVEVKKEEVKAKVTATINEVKALIAENQQLITEAPKGKEGTTALLAMKGELSVLESTLTETNTLLEQGQLQPSLEKATVAKDKATTLNTELKDITSKYKSAKK
ncbi:hypothetical protein [Fulvivirga lutea]|uniref:DUF4398 domain-containing protein n=1 Tax=Fulvivirga lutea TaxID=2810512 RepID=A0A974ZZT8_9BACT|nr:hypothetical protein [Fulvivirga lutea]QSE96490.1 hypothetical protein JR347_12875 [Fulvivirga lutea]